MTRDEFQQAVRQMQADGTPLTIANLLVRTELPRAQIEAWLDDMQRDPRSAVPRPSAPPPDASSARPSRTSVGSRGLVDRLKLFRRDMAADLLKRRLGLGSARPPVGSRRYIRAGALLGVAFPPAGLAYAAPWPVATLGALGYVGLAWAALLLPMLGVPYVLVPMHLAGGFFGAAYAWRFNHGGKRVTLLPGGSTDSRK